MAFAADLEAVREALAEMKKVKVKSYNRLEEKY
jgi:hypothetical protein